MLLGSYQLLLDDPTSFLRLTVLVAFSLLVAVTVHEFSHALVATGLGDNTAKRLGRLSLNPTKHLDPAGTVMMLVAGFGWGKPVPVNQHNLSHGQTGMALVAAAGPLTNIMVAFLLALPIKLGLLDWSAPALNRVSYVMTGGLPEGLADILGLMIFFNILLAVFNLIPLAPLDGSKILAGLLPRNQAQAYARVERYGPALLVGLIMVDYMSNLGILWGVMGPAVRLLATVATGY
ncbi:MAG: site-2 protease family protein [Chloroflexi bacterium]|nr:site-2 protease family protein [Chloroflexota bacterium]